MYAKASQHQLEFFRIRTYKGCSSVEST